MSCMNGIQKWLEKHGLSKYKKVFLENDIGLDIVANLTEVELSSLFDYSCWKGAQSLR